MPSQAQALEEWLSGDPLSSDLFQEVDHALRLGNSSGRSEAVPNERGS